jgi:hypothetical protein
MLIAVGTAAVLAFNLVCSGTVIAAKPAEFSLVIRVDLKSQRYCMDECDHTLPIDQITETEIRFVDDPAGPNGIQRRVSRESGRYYSRTRIEGWLDETDVGRCEVAPFTGFPERKF